MSLSPKAKPHSARVTAHFNFKHDSKKHKTVAHHIRALDLQRIQNHLHARYAHGPAARHKEELKKVLIVAKPFANDSTTVDVTNAAVTCTIDVHVGANDEKFTLL